MALNGFTDVLTTVSVPKPEYEELVRTSERVECLSDYITNSEYVTLEQIKSILGIKKEEKKNGNESVSD